VFDAAFSWVFDGQVCGVTPHWMYTALTRVRDLNKLYMFEGQLPAVAKSIKKKKDKKEAVCQSVPVVSSVPQPALPLVRLRQRTRSGGSAATATATATTTAAGTASASATRHSHSLNLNYSSSFATTPATAPATASAAAPATAPATADTTATTARAGTTTQQGIERALARKIEQHKRADKLAGRTWVEGTYVTVTDVLEMAAHQSCRCAECFCALQFEWEPGDHFQVSIDRIDDYKAHTSENCRLVCLRCNKAKLKGS
jgi:hypothetical protein